MSDTQISRLLLENPGDVAELVPYLVGFTPEESLVIVAIADTQVQVTARADLTDMQQQDAVENLLDRIWAQFPSAEAFLIAYTQDPEPGWAVLERCTDHLPSSALQLTMLVNQDTWHLPDGSQGLVDQSGRVSVAAASQGYQRLARRADLEVRFVSAPNSPALDAAILEALSDLPKYRNLTALLDHTATLIHRNLHSRTPFDEVGASAPISTTDAVQLTQLVQNRHARDRAIASITKATASRHLALWSEVLNRTPSQFAEMPAAIAGMAAWVAGDGASANIALTRAQAEAHSPREAGPTELLNAILDQAVPPSAWPSLRGMILEHADQRVHHSLIPRTRPEQTATAGTRASVPTPEPQRSYPSPPPGPRLWRAASPEWAWRTYRA